SGGTEFCNRGLVDFFDTRSGWGFNYVGFPFTELWVSPASTFYHLETIRTSTNDHDRRLDFSNGLIGVSSSQSFTNTPTDLHHLTIDVPQTEIPRSNRRSCNG